MISDQRIEALKDSLMNGNITWVAEQIRTMMRKDAFRAGVEMGHTCDPQQLAAVIRVLNK